MRAAFRGRRRLAWNRVVFVITVVGHDSLVGHTAADKGEHDQ